MARMVTLIIYYDEDGTYIWETKDIEVMSTN